MSGKQSVELASRFKIGTKVDISINAGLYKGRYASRVEDSKGDDLLCLAHPLLKGVLLPVYRDMSFLMNVEDGTAVYEYEMTVTRIDLKTGVPLLWAQIDGQPMRIQRRRFLRVDSFWTVKIFPLQVGIEKPMQGQWFDARVVDVSLGGYRFKAPYKGEIQQGDRFLLDFMLAGKKYYIEGRASRIRVEENSWDVGVEFDMLPRSVERALFEYIRQQEMMGRG